MRCVTAAAAMGASNLRARGVDANFIGGRGGEGEGGAAAGTIVGEAVKVGRTNYVQTQSLHAASLRI